MAGRDDTSAILSIEGAEADEHVIPAEILIRSLQAIQQMAFLIGADMEKHPYKERFKPDSHLRRQYTVQCHVPQPGSYALPISIGLNDNVMHPNSAVVLDKLYSVFSAVANQVQADFDALFSDSRYLEKALQRVRSVIPKAGEKWRLGFSTGIKPEKVLIADTAVRVVDEWVFRQYEQRDQVLTVTGDFIKVDFEENKVVIRYRPTGRELECVYIPDIEEELLENRRGPIQVTGKFILDDDNNPQKLTDVTRIETVDLSAMIFANIEQDGRILTFTPPLELDPCLDDDSQQLFIVQDDELGIHAFASTRDELIDELYEQIFFLWDSYAQENPDVLTPDAQELRNALRERIREAGNAEEA